MTLAERVVLTLLRRIKFTEPHLHNLRIYIYGRNVWKIIGFVKCLTKFSRNQEISQQKRSTLS